MNTSSFQVFTDAGCVVIFDPESRFEISADWLHSMNHVTDPDGRTCVASDYPEGTWPVVWRQHVARIHKLSQMGEFAFLLCDEVEYACQACEDTKVHKSRLLLASFEEWVHAPSGRLMIADAMTAFNGLDMRHEPFAEIRVTPGWNKVAIHHFQEPDIVAPIIGFEGTVEFPSVVFVLSSLPRSPDLFSPRPVSRLNAPQQPAPGVICDATVTASDEKTVKLRLRKNRTTHSGHGRMHASGSFRHPGNEIRVRLLEDKGAHWSVELA